MKQIINTRHGKMAIHHEKDYIGRSLLNSGQYEWYVVDIMRQLCDAAVPGTVLDIGANVGTKCLPVAQMFPGHQVHAWELQPHVLEILQENIELNSINNIFVHQCGLGNQPQTLSIKQPIYNETENIGAFSINPLVHQHSDISLGHGQEIQVEVRTLDSYQFDLPIQCIKLDAEGYELYILEGGLQTLKDHNYPPVVYELWSYNPWWKTEAAKISNLLTSLGYQIQRIDDTAVCTKTK